MSTRSTNRGNRVCVLDLDRGGEHYVWVWRDDQSSEVIRSFGRFASNPELSFTWYDAAVLAKKVREEL